MCLWGTKKSFQKKVQNHLDFWPCSYPIRAVYPLILAHRAGPDILIEWMVNLDVRFDILPNTLIRISLTLIPSTQTWKKLHTFQWYKVYAEWNCVMSSMFWDKVLLKIAWVWRHWSICGLYKGHDFIWFGFSGKTVVRYLN